MNTTPKPILHFQTEAETSQWAAQLAPLASPGDTVLLEGNIGSGKSAFARAFIRTRLGRYEDIPSPTFTIVQTYTDLNNIDIWHCDLYRLTHADDALELGLQDAFETAICLIEWPNMLGDELPDTALRLAFEAHENYHSVTVIAPQIWQTRIAGLI